MTSKEEATKLAQVKRSLGYRTMMSTPESRLVMWERFEVIGMYQVAPSMEPGVLAFTEGRRSAALQTYNDLLTYCPDLYDRMVEENRARLIRENELTGTEEYTQ